MNSIERQLLNSPANNQMREIISYYWRPGVYRFGVPFNNFVKKKDEKLIPFLALTLAQVLEIDYNIEFGYDICYNKEKVQYYCRGIKMKYCYTIEIPYMQRSNYYQFVLDINNLVDADGIVSLFVNNIPSQLTIYLVIESNINAEAIEALISDNNLKLLRNKGYNELWDEMYQYRRFNSFTLSPVLEMDTLKAIFDWLCFFSEQSEFENRGYVFDSGYNKPKIFISYPHGSKDIVHEMIDSFDRCGLHVWIDKREILPGDNILTAIQQGMKGSDLSVIFLSRETLKGQYAKYELNNIFNKVIRDSMKWFLVKIDDVDVNEICDGLNNYLYYDYSEDPDITNLTETIVKKLNR